VILLVVEIGGLWQILQNNDRSHAGEIENVAGALQPLVVTLTVLSQNSFTFLAVSQ